MHATVMLARAWEPEERRVPVRAVLPGPGRDPSSSSAAATAAGLGDELDQLRRQYARALRALAEAGERAERAERRLRSRLVELTWPAALAGLAGGFAAVVALRLAGA